MRRVLLTALVLAVAICTAAGVWRAVVFARTVSVELEHATGVAQLGPRPQATIVFDRNGRPAFTFFVERRVDVPLDRVAPRMIDAVLAIEDQRFFSHRGVDARRIAGAAWTNLRAGRIRQGGSTITQQLVRVSQLTPRRTFERKLREALIAIRLEERYSKREILQAYLNTVYFGQGFYGVEAASLGYFGKPASDLAAHEAALLAAIVRSPSLDAPAVSPQRARSRRDLVLRRMREQGRLAPAEYDAAIAAPLPAAAATDQAESAVATDARVGQYFEEEVRRQLVAVFGSDRVLRGGLRAYSTYDPALQAAAESAVTTRIAEIASRRSRARDLQGALVAIDPATGDVLALVGGRSFAASRFNRATQAHRQAGSAFKPIVYAAALEHGYAPGSVLDNLDEAIDAGQEEWLPGGEHEAPEYTLRRALEISSNRAAARLLQQVGITSAMFYAQRLGISSRLPVVPSLALGTGEVTLLELTSAYTAFANRGMASAPRLFTRVEDSAGRILYDRHVRQTRAISEASAYMLSSMLFDVVQSGTAAAGIRGAGFRLPAAGKTGTTDDYADAWFIGYTPRLVTGVWFGLDLPAPIMTRGFAGTVAVPAWARFMKEATRGHRASWFDMPPDVERVPICRRSGAPATDGCRYQYVLDAHADPLVYEELVPVRTRASEECSLHDWVTGVTGGAGGTETGGAGGTEADGGGRN